MNRRIIPAFWRIFLFLPLLVSVLQPTLAAACSCAPPPPVIAAREEATAVFAGRVTGQSASFWPWRGSADPIGVTFAVSDVWKGEVRATTTVRTSGGSASCGYTFVAGDTYLVYARGSSDDLTTSLCSRTQPLAGAATDLAALGAAAAPLPATTGGGLLWLCLPALVLLAVAVMTLGRRLRARA